MNKRLKTLLLCLGIVVLLVASSLGIWFLTKEKPASEGNVLGIAWYNENDKEFTINTIEQLKELAELSEYYNFKGQTIKLGADIVDNEGTATDWENELPEHIWKPIKNFAGTFDGQGHTISGICGYGFVYEAAKQTEMVREPAALFTNTQETCVIKDFRLVNSFFYSDFNEGAGSIASDGGGIFDSIYSNATVLSYKQNTGGLIGMLDTRGAHTVTNCWFDGEVRIEGNFGRYTGGIVGRVCDTGGQNKIEHCLNTGTLSSTLDKQGVNLGGIVGNVAPSGRVTIKDCLNVGSVSNEYGVSVGSVLGCVEGKGSANIVDVYTTLDSFSKVVGATLGNAIGLPMEYDRAMLEGYGSYKWTNLDFDKYWAVVEDDTPILKYFAEEIPSLDGLEKEFDTSWYSKNQSEFVITNAKQLYGFSILSRSTDFTGKTVKLGADIVVNSGNAEDWKTEAPEYNWVQIGTVDYPFAGTFDGDMHSISGIHLKTESTYSGLFSTTSDDTVIKNLKLINSYFESDAASFGSIAGRGRGTFDTIYSDAIVVSSKTNLGGFVGQIPANSVFVMKNCWFDGNVIHTGNSLADRRCGGLVGVVYSDAVMMNCLNSGVVDASKYTTPNANNASLVVPLAGGLVGYVGKDKKLTMSDSLNVGKIKVSNVATAGYSSVVGYIDGSVSVSNTYGTQDSCDLHILRNNGSTEVAVIDSNVIKGYGAYQWMLLDFNNYWTVVKSGTPILKSFATEIPSLAGIKKLYDISWYNAGKKTYVLDSMEDLHGFFLMSYNTNFEGKTIKLGADIVVNQGDAATWEQQAPKYKWTPISTNSNPFKGTFDGCMHSISGVYLKTNSLYSGLFGATANEATIKNLKLTNSYFETTALSFGSVAGRGRGTFDTIYSDAIVVSTTGNIGGIIGQIPAESKIRINNCWFDGSVTTTGNTFDDRRSGGLAGTIFSSVSITNCLNTGTVSATKYIVPNTNNKSIVVPFVGGITGYVGKDIDVNISNCLNIGEIKVSDVATAGYGPIVGYRDGNVTITDTYAIAESCDNFSGSRINNMVISIEKSMIEGYGAYQWTSLNFDNYFAVVLDSTPILKSFANSVPSLAGIDKMIDYSWMDQAKGTEKDPYILSDAADLYGFAKLSRDNNFAGKYIKLGANIVVNKDMKNPTYAWTPIGTSSNAFAGTFDGDMHSISGIYLNTNDRFAGLFATTSESAVLKNFTLEDSHIETTAADSGSIVGRGAGTIDTVKSSAVVISSNARVGGFVGQVYSGKTAMTNCWFAGNVMATGNSMSKRATGGLIGYVGEKDVEVTNCLNTGIVDATAYTTPNSATSALVVPLVGGIVGQVHKEAGILVTNSLNAGEVKCSPAALAGTGGYGSVIGYSEGTAKVIDTYATTESCKIVSGGTAKGVSGKINQVSADSIKGYSGYQWTVLDFNQYWAVVLDDVTTGQIDESGTPILKSFTDMVPSLADIDKMIDFSWLNEAEGTEADPYILMDAADLYGLSALSAENPFENKYFRLGADIVVNKGNAGEWKDEAPSYTWTPIGSQSIPFAGIFDGKDLETGVIHSISGIYLNTTSRWAGLFSFTAGTAKIQNLKLKNTYMKTTAADIGSIAGVGNGEFNAIYSEAIIDCGGARSGGLLGQASGADVKMTNCWYAGTITNTSTNAQGTGGLVGIIVNNSKLTMTSCYHSGIVDVSTVSAKQPYAGGLVGQVGQGGSGELIMTDCFIAGTILKHANHSSGYGASVGMVSNKAKSTITKCYFTPESSNRSISVTVANAANNIVGATYSGVPAKASGSLIGDSARTTMPNLAWGTAWETVYGTLPTLKVFKSEVIDTSWYDRAEGTEADPYILYDRADLYGLAMLSQDASYQSFTGKYVRLGADIVVNVGDADNWKNGGPGLVWNPIGTGDLRFNGTFDGENLETKELHTISGLYMNTSNRYAGLFAATGSSSVIKNFKLMNSYFKTTVADIGSIAGLGGNVFHTIYSDALVDCANSRSGGMIGQTNGANVRIDNCWFAGTIKSAAAEYQGIGGFVGVVVGNTKLTMNNCLNTGIVDATQNTKTVPCAGGFIGQAGKVTAGKAQFIIQDSLNIGEIKYNTTKATNGYGSIVGYASGTADIKETYAADGCSRFANGDSGNVTKDAAANVKLTLNDIKGADAQSKMPLLGWGTEWLIVTEPKADLPVLKPFLGVKE